MPRLFAVLAAVALSGTAAQADCAADLHGQWSEILGQPRHLTWGTSFQQDNALTTYSGEGDMAWPDRAQLKQMTSESNGAVTEKHFRITPEGVASGPSPDALAQQADAGAPATWLYQFMSAQLAIAPDGFRDADCSVPQEIGYTLDLEVITAEGPLRLQYRNSLIHSSADEWVLSAKASVQGRDITALTRITAANPQSLN